MAYAACVRSAMLYWSETWAVTAVQKLRLELTERRMLRWISGLSLKVKTPTVELRDHMMLSLMVGVMRRRRLRWYGHELRIGDWDSVKKVISFEVNGKRGKGRPRTNWRRTCALSG